MKYLKNYLLFLEKNATYEFGCVMIEFKFDGWDELKKSIEQEDLYKPEDEQYGFETEPHLTLLYGLHKEVSDKNIEDIIKKFDLKNLVIEIEGIGNFENKEYDVLKFNVIKTSILEKLNNELKQLPNSNKYPDYKPHCTIAYLKNGLSKKYLDENFKKKITEITGIIYSKPDGTKTKIEI